MHVLSLYYTHKPGGFCRRLYRLLNALVKRGHKVTYLSLDQPPDLLNSDVSFSRIPFPASSRGGLIFWACFVAWCPIYVAWIALRTKPDRYLAFGAFYACMFKLALFFKPVPLVLFLRSLVFKIDEITGKPAWLRKITQTVDRIGLGSATKVVCMTQTMRREAEEFLGRPIKRVEILPNDIPALETAHTRLPQHIEDALPINAFIILTAGVLDRRKNIDTLLYALAKLESDKTSRPLVLFVAGEGPNRTELQAKAYALGLKYTYFFGWCDWMETLYRRSHLLVHPALHEGVPNVVMEGLAAKLPILISNIPELVEILPFPEASFLVQDQDDLAAKLQTLVSKPEALSQLKQACEERAKVYTFDWDSKAADSLQN